MLRHLFPILVAVAETGAALVFLWRREWVLATVWGGYAVAAWALARL